MKKKFFADHTGAAEKLFKDVGSNNVKVYDVPEYQNTAQVPVQPPSLTEKWTHVMVATSGDASSGHNWMMIAAYRLDSSKTTNEKCYDIDPVLFVLDSDSGAPHPSGVVAYHQDFPGRTIAISGYDTLELKDAVTDLRTKVTDGIEPLEAAPSEVLSALDHMVKKFRTDFTGGD